MSEPRLEDMSDYNTLKGEKKRIVWTVIIAGLLLGVIYMVAYNKYTDQGDTIPVKDKIMLVPLSQSIPVR